MSRASQEQESQRQAMMKAIVLDAFSKEDLRSMLAAVMATASPYQIDSMLASSKYLNMYNLKFELDI